MSLWKWVALATIALGACGDDGDAQDTAQADSTTATETSATETVSETTVAPEVEDDTTVDTEVPIETEVPTETIEEVEDDTSDVSPDGDDGDTSDADGETSTGPELAGACPLPSRLGGFTVVDDGEYGYISGEIANGVLPVSVLEIVTTIGDCTLYRKENPFCEGTCSPSDTCDYNGECIPFPLPQDLGTATVTGLEGGDAVMSVGPTYFATELPYPPWTGGAALTLRSTGGFFTALALDGVAPQTFSISDTTWTVNRGQPITARWSAPSGEVETHVELQLLIDQHGNAPASVKCNFADDGEGEVPAAIIDAMLDSGVSGFPSGKLVRQTVDSMTIKAGELTGCADFAARAPRSVKVNVSGFTPCTNDNQCPDGQTCNEPIETCVDE